LKSKIIGDNETHATILDLVNQSREISQSTPPSNFEQEYPAEFAKIQRFSKIVEYLKTLYADTEQFLSRYKTIESRQTPNFVNDKEVIQKSISLILKDNSLELLPLKTNIVPQTIQKYFGNI
jgi:hypothetical protein